MRFAVMLALLGLQTQVSRADAPEAAAEFAPADAPADEQALPWWPWAVSTSLLGATLTIELADPTNTSRWSGAGPVDTAFLNWGARDEAGRRRSAIASDVLVALSIAASTSDAVFWPPPAGASRSRVTYRLLAMDALAYSFQGLVVVATKHIARRMRPFTRRCTVGSTVAECTSRSRNQSFSSGHSAFAFTGAALVCTHNRLRGRSLAGHLSCAGALAMASFVGALRIRADRHYFSDVAVGAMVGFVSGYLLPALLWRNPLTRPPPGRMAW